jgi:hypothetical protein
LQTERRYIYVPEKAEMGMSVFEENFMCLTAVRTVEMVDAAEM